MQPLPSRNQFLSSPAAASLLTALESKEVELEITEAVLYRSFPLYKDEEGNAIVSDCVLVSPRHGVVTIALSEATEFSGSESTRCQELVDQVPSFIYSRLIKNRALRKSATQLSFGMTPLIYAPVLDETPSGLEVDVAISPGRLAEFMRQLAKKTDLIAGATFQELIATIEGAKGLIRPKKRQADLQPGSKGKQADAVEAAITLFDQQQKHGMMGRVTGPQRVRGLAGSGKTVVLAMKAAQTHLQLPDARIAYTFYTKSLYQHVKRLITRFYRQFDDRDPDWDRLQVLHGWGGHSAPGIYSVACEQNGIPPIGYQEAAAQTFGDRFDYVCTALQKQKDVQPFYDYVFVDEGQDFPVSFVRLCHQLAKDGKFVLAYDDLQTIFQATTPSTLEIFGTGTDGQSVTEFEEDFVLYKCYRNPREILVTAHALGFSIYGPRIVQMIESEEHWEDVGYFVEEGNFKAGSLMRIERPAGNSLELISRQNSFDEIVQCHVMQKIETEIEFVVSSIRADIADGLQPEDVLVVSVDDRNAKRYLADIEVGLNKYSISANNLHNDTFGIRDFTKDGRVTLATVHKAKGNEAFVVYVVGVDAAMEPCTVRNRNILFTAMTRAKGWVRITGVGVGAQKCKDEIDAAKKHYPFLVFNYPPPADMKRIKRDLAESADKRMRTRRLLDQLHQEYSDHELSEMLEESKSAIRSKGRTQKFSFKKGLK